jgi:hypothetical protein
VTGLVALQSTIDRLLATRHFVILSGVQSQPTAVLARAGVRPREGKLAICASLEEAVLVAKGKRRATSEMNATGGSRRR